MRRATLNGICKRNWKRDRTKLHGILCLELLVNTELFDIFHTMVRGKRKYVGNGSYLLNYSYAASLSVGKNYLLPLFTNTAFTCFVTSLQLIETY